MAHQIIIIEKATPECLREVLDLLSKVGLPPNGVEEYFSSFLIARSCGGEVVGCVGLERHGKIGDSVHSRNTEPHRLTEGTRSSRFTEASPMNRDLSA